MFARNALDTYTDCAEDAIKFLSIPDKSSKPVA